MEDKTTGRRAFKVIPDEKDALALHAKYGSSSAIVNHCKMVATAAKILLDAAKANGRRVDSRAAYAAALLHDIGRSRTHDVSHGVVGASILKQEGIDDKVIEIVRKHVGAGISKDEARSLGLPDYDYIPRTLEEKIVCFADKLVDSVVVRPLEGEIRRFVRKGHDVGRLLALKEGLRNELGEDPEALVLNKIKETDRNPV